MLLLFLGLLYTVLSKLALIVDKNLQITSHYIMDKITTFSQIGKKIDLPLLRQSIFILYYPRLATITALIVCILFSASSNTTEYLLSNTSSVTSKAVNPNLLYISIPTFVLRS